jgi:hypothetical protein
MITTLHTLSLASNQTYVSRVVGSILPIAQIKENHCEYLKKKVVASILVDRTPAKNLRQLLAP